MGTLLYPHEGYAQVVMEQLFEQYESITTKQFNTELKQIYPDYDWSFIWCSKFLLNKCNYIGEGESRNWYPTEDIFEIEFKHLLENPVSKKHLRKECDNFALRQERFEHLFSKYAVWEGDYNKENHRLYILKKDITKAFTTLTKKELEYLIVHINKLDKTVTEPQSKLHQLLKSYFTYDIKQCVNS